MRIQIFHISDFTLISHYNEFMYIYCRKNYFFLCRLLQDHRRGRWSTFSILSILQFFFLLLLFEDDFITVFVKH